MSSPRVLSNMILFLTGKVFCLRGGQEHYALKLSQFTFATGLVSGEQRECVVDVENGSKNHSGSYKDKGSNKSVRHYEDPQLGERCYVSILKFYLSKLPESAKDADIFYLRPKAGVPNDPAAPWFIQSPGG